MKKRRGGNGGWAWKSAALMCIGLRSSSVCLSARPTDSDPPGQEKQTHSGRRRQRDCWWRYFYHFHKGAAGQEGEGAGAGVEGDAFPSC